MRLLFDCHVARATLGALRRLDPRLQAEHLAGWHGGAWLRAADAEILAICHEEQRVFVTFDLRTVPDLLRQWAAEDRPHSGVIFGDANSVSPNRPAAVAAAVAAIVKELGNEDTVNFVRFLRAEVG